MDKKLIGYIDEVIEQTNHLIHLYERQGDEIKKKDDLEGKAFKQVLICFLTILVGLYFVDVIHESVAYMFFVSGFISLVSGYSYFKSAEKTYRSFNKEVEESLKSGLNLNFLRVNRSHYNILELHHSRNRIKTLEFVRDVFGKEIQVYIIKRPLVTGTILEKSKIFEENFLFKDKDKCFQIAIDEDSYKLLYEEDIPVRTIKI